MPKGLKLKVNGRVVWETDERVDRVSLRSPRGEVGGAGVDESDTEFDLRVEMTPPAATPRLEDVRDAQRQAVRDNVKQKDKERKAVHTGFVAGAAKK